MEGDGSAILSEIDETADLLDDTSDAPIIKLVNHIISQSIKARASDIHFEPYQNSFTVRYRVDGILYDLLSPPKWIQPALISRVKVMAKMNIAEKRLPQDGRFDVRVGDQDIDVRVSTIPTSFGERLVLRLLNKSGSLLELSDLGLSPQRMQLLQKLVVSPNGIILVTGPTGSGKTTTLYAILQSINKPDINIITIEDPVEYQMKGISQIQVNPKIDLTFARGLRSIVRQDPDVILIGEIRDKETADIAVQSALTGHLVFSTLHTNDSPSAITRLVDIGVEPFLISSSVLAVFAQRLVRVLCTECKQPYSPKTVYLQSIGVRPERFAGKPIFKAVGCEKCFQTGYRGRLGIFEIMVMSDELKTLIIQTYDSNRIKALATQEKMISLREDGIDKVLSTWKRCCGSPRGSQRRRGGPASALCFRPRRLRRTGCTPRRAAIARLESALGRRSLFRPKWPDKSRCLQLSGLTSYKGQGQGARAVRRGAEGRLRRCASGHGGCGVRVYASPRGHRTP